MKYLTLTQSVIKTIGIVALIALVISFVSCSRPHWYAARHSGCQSSQGFAGY